MDEQSAIQRLKQGDISGLEYLVNRYQTKAVHTAYLITRDPGLAQEIVQEAFLRAYRAIRSFRIGRPFEPWFLRSVVNASIKAVKKSGRQVPIGEESEPQAFAELYAQMESVEAQVESAELEGRVWEAMDRLPARQRAAIVERYFLDMGEKDMAAELNAAPGTVKWLLNAARKRLRILLAERRDE